MRKRIYIITLLVISLINIKCSKNKEETINQNSRKQLIADVNNPIVDPIEAMNNPSKHAWDLFLFVNHPAKDYKTERGVPDNSKKIGEDGLVVWETWKHAGTEVFLEDGRKPPVWEDYSLDPYLNNKGKTFEGSTAALISEINKNGKKNIQESTKAFVDHSQLEFNPDDGLIGNGGETRMNKSTFEFIVKNSLYNLQGIDKFRNDYLKTDASKRKPLSFEKESIEVKAMWKKFSEEEIQKGIQKKYYVATDADGFKYGLTSLHIITKEIPNWFWCSFRHKDGPDPEVPSVDTYGSPQELKGTFWENYELSGTQTSFTDSRGVANRLSDPNIEDGFQNSSCITCHATAVVGPGAMIRDGGRLLFTQSQVIGNGNVGETLGTPKESWYKDKNGQEQLVQLDFVYSIPFRAHKKI